MRIKQSLTCSGCWGSGSGWSHWQRKDTTWSFTVVIQVHQYQVLPVVVVVAGARVVVCTVVRVVVVGVTLVVVVVVVVAVGVVVTVVVTSSKQAKTLTVLMSILLGASGAALATIFTTVAKTLLGSLARTVSGLASSGLKTFAEKHKVSELLSRTMDSM